MFDLIGKIAHAGAAGVSAPEEMIQTRHLSKQEQER